MNQDLLIVSSQEKMALQLKELLLLSGYNVSAIVENGAHLSESLANYSPSVVLLDCSLSSGQSISEISFNLKHHYKVAVVLICGDNPKNQFLDDGYYENIISAPFTAKDVISAIAISLYQKKHIQITAMEQDLFLDTISLHV